MSTTYEPGGKAPLFELEDPLPELEDPLSELEDPLPELEEPPPEWDEPELLATLPLDPELLDGPTTIAPLSST